MGNSEEKRSRSQTTNEPSSVLPSLSVHGEGLYEYLARDGQDVNSDPLIHVTSSIAGLSSSQLSLSLSLLNIKRTLLTIMK
jgi:hypothetical protein